MCAITTVAQRLTSSSRVLVRITKFRSDASIQIQPGRENMVSQEQHHEGLIERARSAACNAYAPYSGFHVGAALLCSDGEVFCGANVENRSYGLTCCAERSAVFAAVSAGKQSFAAIAIYSPDSPHPLPPCGACRQVIAEFGAEIDVLCCGSEGSVHRCRISDLLPLDSLHELR
jgi:cytidine deaminase